MRSAFAGVRKALKCASPKLLLAQISLSFRRQGRFPMLESPQRSNNKWFGDARVYFLQRFHITITSWRVLRAAPIYFLVRTPRDFQSDLPGSSTLKLATLVRSDSLWLFDIVRCLAGACSSQPSGNCPYSIVLTGDPLRASDAG